MSNPVYVLTKHRYIPSEGIEYESSVEILGVFASQEDADTVRKVLYDRAEAGENGDVLSGLVEDTHGLKVEEAPFGGLAGLERV